VAGHDAIRARYRREGQRLVVEACEAIASGRVAPYEGARRIWLDAWPLLADEPEASAVAPFIGEASQWEDHPEVRAQIEASIVEKAGVLLEAWRSAGQAEG
jgi:hypothetical protein